MHYSTRPIVRQADGASGTVIAALHGLRGRTLRGVRDEELAGLRQPVAVLPSAPANATHRRQTVDELLRLLPSAVELPG